MKMKGVIKRVMAVFLSLMLGLMPAACGGKAAEQKSGMQEVERNLKEVWNNCQQKFGGLMV